MKKTKKDIESEIKTLEGKLAELKDELGQTNTADLNEVFKDYLHVWLDFPGYEDMTYLVNIDSFEYIADDEIGFAGTVLELGTVNTEHNGIVVKVETTDYGKKYLHRLLDLPHLCDCDYEDGPESIKDQLDGYIEDRYIEKVTPAEAKEIILSHMYWSIWEGTENGVLEEELNPLNEFANL
jgi:hypothetical protein